MNSSHAMKLRVLCLHGFRQTGDKLRVRISGLRRAFKSSVEFGEEIVLPCDCGS